MYFEKEWFHDILTQKALPNYVQVIEVLLGALALEEPECEKHDDITVPDE